jgi:hypothetical protein
MSMRVAERMLIRTCRAARPEEETTAPLRASSRIVPTGAEEAVAVVTETFSHTAHKEESASPRNPKVRTVVRSENEASLDVWCFKAE